MTHRADGLSVQGVSRTATVCNQRGLHARAAAKFVKTASSFTADITVSRCGQSVGGGSIMGLMMLAAGPGCEIVIEAAGDGAEAAVEALVGLVERGFDEN